MMGVKTAVGDPPTDRQREILAFIVESSATMGRPPTLRDIGVRFHIASTNGVNDHIRYLIKRGLVERPALKSRGILVTDLGLAALGLATCPLCRGKGHVAAHGGRR